MSSRNRFVLIVVMAALAVLVGCTTTNKATPPPTGGFTNANLKGAYVFSFAGTDVSTGSAAPFAVLGVLNADGGGGISGGTIDINDPVVGAFTSGALSPGHYSITKDGRGQGSLVTSLGTIEIDFVLTSGGHGLVTRFDGGGSGSGTIDLQSTVTQSALAGSYTFSLVGTSLADGTPLASVGAFTIGATGAISSNSFQDVNHNFDSIGLTDMSLTGQVILGPSSTPTTQLNSNFGALVFDVYAIDNTHLKLVEDDGIGLLSGDAFTQQTSFPSGQLVYTASGIDTSQLLLVTGGYLTSDGTSTISNGLQDINDGGSIGQATNIGGPIVPPGVPATGRFEFTLNGFYNATGLPVSATFAAYPFTSGGVQGVQFLEIDNAGITGGTAFQQSSTTLASAQGYGLNLSGQNANGEEDDIAEFATTSGTLSGLTDQNNEGSLNPDATLGNSSNATYSVDSNGRGTMTTLTFTSDFYVVNSGSFIFIEVDTSQAAAGSFAVQSNALPAVAALRPIIRPNLASHPALRRKAADDRNK
jgi:hypothetical protein